MPLVHKREAPSMGLFGTCEGNILEVFESSFTQWVAHAKAAGEVGQASTVDAYQAIWTSLTKWCVAQNPVVSLDGLREAELGLFIESRTASQGSDHQVSGRHAWRVLHLVDRVQELRASVLGIKANRAAHELLNSREDWRYANSTARDPLPEFLSAGEAKTLVNFLTSTWPEAAGPEGGGSWQELRNRASVGLQLGAGLTPSDVRALTLKSPVVVGGRIKNLPWKIEVPQHGASVARETPVARWAARVLSQWLSIRAEMAIPGEYLFPSTKTGKPWGKVAHYNAVTAVLEDSGVDKSLVPGGSFRLRHTFALRQLRRNRAPEEVAQWLGVVDPAVMKRYKRVIFAPVDDLA